MRRLVAWHSTLRAHGAGSWRHAAWGPGIAARMGCSGGATGAAARRPGDGYGPSTFWPWGRHYDAGGTSSSIGLWKMCVPCRGKRPTGLRVSLSVVCALQPRQVYTHVDPSMAFAYGPALGMSSRLGRRLPEFGDSLPAAQPAFQQPGRGLQGPADTSGPGGQQHGSAYQPGHQKQGDL